MTRDRIAVVTGAGGFIGSHLVEKLIAEGFRVRAMVHYRGDGGTGWLSKASIDDPKLEVIPGDIRDHAQVVKLLTGVDSVFNLAALIGIPYSFEAPASYVQTNVFGTLNLLEAARHVGVKAFVQTSTSEVYGTAQEVPMSEAHRLNPQSPYAASKVASDAIALSYFHSYSLPVSILRPFNTFGPRQSTRAVIPTIIRQLIQGTSGKIYLGALETRRDFTFISDTIQGFFNCYTHIESAQGKAINLGAGWDVSIGEVVDLCGKLIGTPYTVVEEPARIRPNSSEVERLWSDNRLAQKVLGWTPISSSKEKFVDGLQETISWWRLRLKENGDSSDKFHK